MKKFNIYLLVVILLAGVTGCSDWLDVNEDPNNLTTSTKDLVLTGAQKQFAERQQIGAGFSLLGAWTGYYAHSGGWSGWTNVKSYNMTSSDYNGFFNDPYRAELKSLQYVEQKGWEDQNVAYVAMARLLTAVTYQRMVDVYGDIPYSEAVEGFNGLVSPVYDDAQAIYDDLIVQIDTSILLFNQAIENSNTIESGADLIGGGDITTWLQLANTFKLRVLMRQTEARESYVSSNMSFDAAGFITESATANPGYIDKTDGKMNPLYGTYGRYFDDVLTNGNQQYVLNVFLLNLYNKSNDPRLQLAWEPGANNGNYSHGVQLGQNGDPEDHHSTGSAIRMGPGLYGGSSNGDVMVVSAMETNFLIAEALARGYNLSSAGVDGTAKEYWTMGIEESFAYYASRKDVDYEDDLALYLDNLTGDASWDDANPVKSIIYQKYIAGLGVNHFEAWSDYRRTGYPEAGDPNSIETSMISYYFNIVREQVPVRMLYVQRETDINEENVKAAITKTGVTYDSEFIMDARIFWDVN